MSHLRWLLLLLGCFIVPVHGRADGIDLPVLIGVGAGILVPLLLFNTAVEAPILAGQLGLTSRQWWWPWFKANVWSLLSGIPVLLFNEALKEWLVPKELGGRVRVYPFFLASSIGIYYLATVLVELAYGRRFLRRTGLRVGAGRLCQAVVLANAASYLVLGSILYYREYPRSEVREFTQDTRWARQPTVTVVAVGRNGHLEAVRADGAGGRVVVPHEVHDYVVSADLSRVLYRDAEDRFGFFQHGTNVLLPDLGLRCRAPGMDFSPDGRYAAFAGRIGSTDVLRVCDLTTVTVREVSPIGGGPGRTLVWSSSPDTFYLQSNREYWAIALGEEIVCTQLARAPEDLAVHYGRVGTRWGYDGVSYSQHQQGQRKLLVVPGWGSRLWIDGPEGRLLTLRDPAGSLPVSQAVFLEGGAEVLVELGGYVYLVDPDAKRLGPVVQGERFIAIADPFSKRAGF